MSRFRLVTALLSFGLLFATSAGAQQPAPQSPAPPTAAEAAPFMGDWTINGESQMGPVVISLSIKTTDAKLQGELSSEQMPKTVITDIVKNGPSLLLRYSFDYQGQAIPAEITLTPNGDKIGALIDFAGGAFVVTGTAMKAGK